MTDKFNDALVGVLRQATVDPETGRGLGDDEAPRLCVSDIHAVVAWMEALEAENARLREALAEAAEELDDYYRREHPEADRYPDEQRKLERAMASNPARAALEPDAASG